MNERWRDEGGQARQQLQRGPEASLVVSAGGTWTERVGSFETGFSENDDNRRLWAVPNVLGVRAPGAR